MKKKAKKGLLLVELPDSIKREFRAAAKKRDWSMRKAAKHAIEEWIRSEAAQ